MNECINCKAKLRGRSDKKYCSDLCRTRYHNDKREVTTTVVRKVNYILNKNRSILEGYSYLDGDKIQKNRLLEDGFNFSYHTHIDRVADEEPFYYCYDFGYCYLNNTYLRLVKRV